MVDPADHRRLALNLLSTVAAAASETPPPGAVGVEAAVLLVLAVLGPPLLEALLAGWMPQRAAAVV